MKVTTKSCPVCGNTQLALIGTSNLKVCIDHNPYVRIPWYLDEGQDPLLYNIDRDMMSETLKEK